MKAERLVEMYHGDNDLLAFARWLTKHGYVFRTLLIMDTFRTALPNKRCEQFLTKIGFEWDCALNVTVTGLVPVPPCIVCGARAARAVGLPYAPFAEILNGVWVIPHPNSRHTEWDSPEACERGKVLAKEIKEWKPKTT